MDRPRCWRRSGCHHIRRDHPSGPYAGEPYRQEVEHGGRVVAKIVYVVGEARPELKVEAQRPVARGP